MIERTLMTSAMMAASAVKQKINPMDVSHYQNLVKPHWYDQ